MNWNEAKEMFEAGMKLQSKSPNTISAYLRDLSILEKKCSAPLECTAREIQVAFRSSRQGGMTASSAARAISSWKAFFQYLQKMDARLDNPTLGLKAPKKEKALPKALTLVDAQTLLDTVQQAEGDNLHNRDKAIFELMYSSGLRVQEVQDLNVASIDLETGLCRVLGKGNKERIVPVGKVAVAALQAYLLQRTPKDPLEVALFLSEEGERLQVRQIRNRLYLWSQKSGLGKKVSPHQLRHSCASHLLQSSGDLRGVQEILGHESVRSTQIYTDIDVQHLKNVLATTHPRGKK